MSIFTSFDFNIVAVYLISTAMLFSTITAIMPLFLQKRGALNYLSSIIALSIGVYAMTDTIYRHGYSRVFIDWHYAGTAIPAVLSSTLVIYLRVLFSRQKAAMRTMFAEYLFPVVLFALCVTLTLYALIFGKDHIAVVPPSFPMQNTVGSVAFVVQFLVFLWCFIALSRAAFVSFTTNPVFRKKNTCLRYFTPFSVYISILFFLTGISYLLMSPQFIILYRLVFVSSFFFQVLTVIVGFTFPDIFSGPESPLSEYRRSKISSLDTQKAVREIDRIMTEESLYRNENLSLEMLAMRSGLTRHQLSEILNTVVGQNFNAFVNSYRITEAIQLLGNEPDATILSIAYRCGFNSKTTFNNLFTKHTGMKPSEYRIRNTAKSTK